jgi:2-dehydro-3-deoxyphosphogluconate aldolase/(4S)-4-hydroxy-2-oxoglutarate aldolase
MKPAKADILHTIETTGLVPLFYHADVATAIQVAEASYRGGSRVFEFAHRGPNAFEVFCKLTNHFSSNKNFYLGIGTVLDATTAKQYMDAGAHFLVSPVFKSEIAEVVNRENVLWIPGCATMTEIVTALDAGADLVKVFPGSVLGPGFVSSVLPILPKIKLMPTGGVEPNGKNLSSWFNAGVFCVGMGSQLYPSHYIESGNWEAIEHLVRDTLAIIRRVKKH